MNFIKPLMAGLLLSASLTLSAASNNQMAMEFSFQQTRNINVDYLLFLPEGYRDQGAKRWPLILFLHGAGERGTNVWKAATHGPPKYVRSHPEFPFILVTPQCPAGQRWSNDVLLALLDDVIARHAVDTNRLYLTGLSMGGYGTWSLGMSHPEKFAAIAPICGGGEMITLLLSSYDRGEALRSLGVWAFHGARDPVVPLAESERMIEGLKKAGVRDVQLTIDPEAGHDSWTKAYNDPALYEWMLKHHRGGN